MAFTNIFTDIKAPPPILISGFILVAKTGFKANQVLFTAGQIEIIFKQTGILDKAGLKPSRYDFIANYLLFNNMLREFKNKNPYFDLLKLIPEDYNQVLVTRLPDRDALHDTDEMRKIRHQGREQRIEESLICLRDFLTLGGKTEVEISIAAKLISILNLYPSLHELQLLDFLTARNIFIQKAESSQKFDIEATVDFLVSNIGNI